MWTSAERLILPDHPTADGHFPGAPILPGAVLLDEVLDAIGARERAGEIRAAKFLSPVRPGDRLTIRWRPGADGTVAFEARVGERLAASGSIRVPAPQP